jgi:hypothetical protein
MIGHPKRLPSVRSSTAPADPSPDHTANRHRNCQATPGRKPKINHPSGKEAVHHPSYPGDSDAKNRTALSSSRHLTRQPSNAAAQAAAHRPSYGTWKCAQPCTPPEASAQVPFGRTQHEAEGKTTGYRSPQFPHRRSAEHPDNQFQNGGNNLVLGLGMLTSWQHTAHGTLPGRIVTSGSLHRKPKSRAGSNK